MDLLMCLVGVRNFISLVCATGAIIAGIVFGTGCGTMEFACGI